MTMGKATRQQIKEHNTQLILKTVYDGEPISRAEIARSTGLTRTTVSDIVGILMAEGLVAETGVGPSSGGKPPVLLSIVGDSRFVIGVDLASTEFRGAVIDLRGKIRNRINLPIHDRSGDIALFLVYQLIDHLMKVAGRRALGVGIGTPGLMDTERGIVRNAVNLDWVDLELGRLLEERYNLPVYIANDCQVAALAEFTYGSGERASNLVLIRLGRGVGAGIVLNQRMYAGDGFGAGEIGHVKVVENGDLCYGHF
jgi:hypothetical protein